MADSIRDQGNTNFAASEIRIVKVKKHRGEVWSWWVTYNYEYYASCNDVTNTLVNTHY